MQENEKMEGVALKIKWQMLKKFQQITLLVELYCDDKKILKYLRKIVGKEEKAFQGSHFSKTESVFEEVYKFLEKTSAVIKALLSANTVEEFNRAKRMMETHLYELEQALKPVFSTVEKEAKGIIEKAKEKVKSLKNIALEGFEKIKNNVCDTIDQDCESV